ncbi:STAS domain-containing protein [candidate division FCPU426 bacterium]|nr:STAS domain-containing protein [candidate division FCPU426 bacterium]
MGDEIIISQNTMGNVEVVKIKGFMSISNYMQFESILNQLIQKGSIKIILDLSELDYISSAGLGVILGSIKETQKLGGDIKVGGCSQEVRNILDVFGFTQVFTVSATPAAAKVLFGKT